MSEKKQIEGEAELRFSSSGVQIAIQAAPRIIDGLSDFLPPDAQPWSRESLDRCYRIVDEGSMSESGKAFSLYAESTLVGSTGSFYELCRLFEEESRLFVAEVSRERVILHAGVVGWRGKAVIIPGASWSGKTTLVVALVAAGATYLSDEYAVLDRANRVHPYLKQLSIRQEGAAPRICAVEEIGGRRCTEPLEVGLALVTEFRPGALWDPLRLSASEGVLALAKNSVSIRRSPSMVLDALKRIVIAAPVLCGPRGEAEQVVAYLRNESIL